MDHNVNRNMDCNVEWLYEKRVERTMTQLKKNGFAVHYFPSSVDYLTYLDGLLPEGCKVTVGGSRTVFETGTIELLQSGRYDYLDRYAEGLTPADIKELYRDSFSADYYVMSSNAVTENGYLFNVDGTGNRVAALTYGPDNVLVVVGINKLVKDEEEALLRLQETAAPANSKRLSRKTPCAQTGTCSECESPERICHSYLLTKRNTYDRVTVIIIGESLGY